MMEREELTNAVDRLHAVSYVSGQVASDGQSVLLRVETAEDKPIKLAVAMPHLQHLTTLLFLLRDGGPSCQDDLRRRLTRQRWRR